MNQQDASYWKSNESTKRYVDIPERLFDIERVFLLEATDRLRKKTSEIKILDLGCGGGRTTIPLLKYGFDVLGVDVAENLIEGLQKKIGTERAQVGDAANLSGFADNSFDVVLFSHNSIDCLYPASSREKSLQEISRVLKSGGYFIFSTHRFNPIPFNWHTLQNILLNIPRLPQLLFRSGFYEEMIDGEKIVLFASSQEYFVKKELSRNALQFVRGSDYTMLENNNCRSFLKAFFSWERYYLAIKK